VGGAGQPLGKRHPSRDEWMNPALLPDEQWKPSLITGVFWVKRFLGRSIMTKTILALGAAALALSAMPAQARHERTCAHWRHGHCVRWMNHGYEVSMSRHQRYRVGYRFGPDYNYTAYSAIPQTYVTRYRLDPDYRYVYRDNYIYVVDPTTYAITRILNAIPH
jgi:hypothetical protein